VFHIVTLCARHSRAIRHTIEVSKTPPGHRADRKRDQRNGEQGQEPLRVDERDAQG
jgi:hypothetical protein